MAEEVRRSGRANKGHHTKNQDLDEPPMPKPKSKSKADNKKASTPVQQSARELSAQSGDQADEGDAVIRCVCGDQRDIRGRQMICCDKCEVWQHNKCLNLPEGDFWDEKQYFCEQCNPEDHVELLAAMARGEKPWARKKGNKNKPRTSNIKPDPDAEKPKGPTPQPTQASTPTTAVPQAPMQTSTQAPPAQDPTQDPVPVPHEAPQVASNGNAESKQLKRESPKSQPQSPGGEKRRHESATEKDGSSKKRRKSSNHQQQQQQQQEKAASQSGAATDIEALPQKQRAVAERVRDTLAQCINAASDSRGYRIPDGETPKSIATRLTLLIEHAAVLHHGEPSGGDSSYSQHMRSILFNVKKNAALVDRLLSGSLTPQEFASMSPEEMASEEKQREYAAMREANEKQMVLTEETGPRLRKTHKGEELVGGDDMVVSHEFRPPERRDREDVPDEKPAEPQSPARDGHTVELPEDVGRTPLAVDTSASQSDHARRPSTNFDIQSVFDQVRSPQNNQQNFLRRRQSSTRGQDKQQQGPGDDADIDRLLKDDDGDVDMSGYSGDPTVVWKGQLSMQSTEPFDAVARFVAGGDFGRVIPWNQLLSPTLPIQGRIESQKGDEYIQGLASSGSHDVCVLGITPQNSEGRAVMDHLYNYFHPRDRWGVVPVDKLGNDTMRDLYVIPIEPGGSSLPPFLEMLEYCTIETPRKEHMIVLALVAKLPEPQPALPTAQHFNQRQAQESVATQVTPAVAPVNGPTNGPSPSPLTNPHAPSYSPVSAAFPPTQNYGNPYAQPPANNGHAQQVPSPDSYAHHRVPRALEIFGAYIDEPVIKHMLTLGPDMAVVHMENLRHIVEHFPETRNDMSALHKHLNEKNAANGQKQG